MILLLSIGCRTVLTADGDAAGAPWRWNALLEHAVTSDGRVDYDVVEAERQALDDYVVWLSRPAVYGGPLKVDRHAFWVNAYNALTIFQVLERGRPASVMDVGGILPMAGSGFFVETAFDVGGVNLSLSEIEHEKLRMVELDFRDHAAINCASASCPPLRAGLYDADLLDEQLDEQMALWVADDARGVRVEADQAVFSPIFDWYARDFEFPGHGDSLCALTARFAEGDKKSALERLDREGCPHRFAVYDWSLNHSPRY